MRDERPVQARVREVPVSDKPAAPTGGPTGARGAIALTPERCPSWLRPLVDNIGQIPEAYRHRLPAPVLAMVTAAKAASSLASLRGEDREAAVLVLFSGPESGPADGGVPDDADLLLTVRASTLRHHAGQAAFPGGASDPTDDGPVATALREAREETGIDVSRLHPLVTLERTFIAPSRFHVVPVLAYSPDPGPVAVVDETETAIVSRVPVRAFINPENRLMVYRGNLGRRWAGPAFLLNQMLVWGFTGQVISAVLDVAGWALPWDTTDIRELDDAMMLVGESGRRR
ncbi:MAG: CoA pyrophosphatase [Mycobacterium sp.]|nr:CoA pyrophosphatase [Mycobacterium sp.]